MNNKLKQIKKCTICGEYKPRTEFYKKPTAKNPNYIRGECKICSNKNRIKLRETNPTEYSRRNQKYNLKRLYNLTIVQRKEMYISQNGCCAICGKPIPYNDMQTDHNHVTNQNRGLICKPCNLGIGFLDENTETLQNAIIYLNQYEET